MVSGVKNIFECWITGGSEDDPLPHLSLEILSVTSSCGYRFLAPPLASQFINLSLHTECCCFTCSVRCDLPVPAVSSASG